MNAKEITIDFDGLDENGLNQLLKDVLGFPNFYGMNWDAMIDCLGYMRFPDCEMSKVFLDIDEVLIINCKNLFKADLDTNIFLDVIETVNQREIDDGRKPQILLNLFR